MKRNACLMKWFLVFVIVLGVIVLSGASADLGSGTWGKNLTWVLSDDGVLTISGTGEMQGALHNFPWFSLKNSIRSVEIIQGVTSIGSGAFMQYNNLTSVTIPDSVTSIDGCAFAHSNNVTEIHIDSITSWLKITGRDTGSFPYSEKGTHLFIDDIELTSIIVPEDITSIRDCAFWYCSSLTSITIPDSVTSIGDYAFQNCSSLTSITIPESVTSIGDFAFSGCSSLTSITIPKSVKSIGKYAFRNCSSLPNISFPEGLTSIGAYAFMDCSNLKSISIPDSLVPSNNYIFNDDDGINSYYGIIYCNLESPVAYYLGKLGKYFRVPGTNYSLRYLYNDTVIVGLEIQNVDKDVETFEIPEGVTSIGNSAFSGCSSLTSITIPDGMTSIGNNAFYKCSSLTSIAIPDSVTSIGSRAFYECSSLTSITILDGVTSIGNSAFWGCSAKRYANMDSEGAKALSKAGYSFWTPGSNYSLKYIFSNQEITGLILASADKDITEITIPEGVTSIGNSAFSGCRSLTSLMIPEGVTSIGENAFYGCRSLTSLTIPEGVTSIGNSTFSGCSSLTSITIPESVTSIDNAAFSDCSSLTSITIPDGVTSIGYSTFAGCSSMTTIMIPDGVTSIESYGFQNCSSLTSITIPEGVTSIGEYAFYGCNSLTSLMIPEGVTSIGNNAFYGCSSLTSIAIPQGVTSISYSAFYGCSSLKSITIPDGVTSIDHYAFYNCSSLKSITIPDGVTSIGDYAFWDCSSLTSITIPEDVKNIGNYFYSGYADIVISDSFVPSNDYIFDGSYGKIYCSLESPTAYYLSERGRSFLTVGANYALCYLYDNKTVVGLEIRSVNTNEETFVIPEYITSIGNYAFLGCSSLTSLTIPDGVTSIGDYAFHGCSSLTSITIPGNVTSIEDYAFSYCTGLKSITIPENITSIGNNAFDNCSSLKSITFAEGVTSIGNNAFQGCSSLTSITIPNSVTSIGDYAFQGCGNLQRLAIPESVTTFGSYIVDSNATIYCFSFSDADYWATSQGLSTVYLDQISPTDCRVISIENDSKLALGDELPLVYNVFPALDHPAVSWRSSNPAVVSVENGMVTGLHVGNATIIATCENIEARLFIRVYRPAVDFELQPAEAWVLARTESCQLNPVNLSPADAELFLNWTCSDTEFATVDENGLVTTIKPGQVTITATSERGVKSTAVINLCYPVKEIELSAPQDRMLVGRQMQLTAIVTPTRGEVLENHLVNFSSSDETIAEVEADTGLVTALAPGEVTITAFKGDKSVETTILVIERCNEHRPVTDAGVPPTCEESGISDGSHCAICDKILVEKEVLPPLGHEWGEATYTWHEDNSKVTASRVCAHDAEHIETETVTATSEITKVATCEEKGETTYTGAEFENEAFTAQTKTVDDIPALGHAWSEPIYVWNDDNSQVTATRVCERDTEHVETETVDVTYEITKAATCEEKGETTYTSETFGNEGFAVQTKMEPNIPALGHEWGEATYTWHADNSKVTASRVCAHDAKHAESETVNTTSEVINAATCEEKGETTYTSAEFENEAFAVQMKTVDDIPALGHSWDRPMYVWSYDYLTMTATRTCRNGDHPETETVETYRVLVTAPTNEEAGVYHIFSNEFENPAFTVQSNMNLAVPALKDMNVLKLPTFLTTLETEAFDGIAAEAVIIPDGCTTIEPRAFVDCENLLYVRVPAGVEIPEDAFSGCPYVMIDQR